MSAAVKADLIQPQDYAKATLKVFGAAFLQKGGSSSAEGKKAEGRTLIEVEQAVGECEVYGFIFDGEFDDEVVGGGDHYFFAAQVDDE